MFLWYFTEFFDALKNNLQCANYIYITFIATQHLQII